MTKRRRRRVEVLTQCVLSKKPVTICMGVDRGRLYLSAFAITGVKGKAHGRSYVFRHLSERESHNLFHDLLQAAGYETMSPRRRGVVGDALASSIARYRGNPEVLIRVGLMAKRAGILGNLSAIITPHAAAKVVQKLADPLGWDLWEEAA